MRFSLPFDERLIRIDPASTVRSDYTVVKTKREIGLDGHISLHFTGICADCRSAPKGRRSARADAVI